VSYAVRAEAAEEVVAEIATAGGRAIAVAADVADSAAVQAMVTRAEAALCPGAGPARHHRERRGGRLRPHRHDAARPRRGGLAGDGGTVTGPSSVIGEPEASPMPWCSWLHRSEVGLRRRC